MSDSATKNVFEEWMEPFMNDEKQESQQHSEDQLDLFSELENEDNA